MAGSAVNLTGMLSQINSNLGNMGNTVGEALFNPLLEIQKEQRAEEERKRLEAEKIAKLRGMQGDITQANNVAHAAQMDPSADGSQIARARAVLQEKAAMNPEQAQMYLAQDAKLAQQEIALQQRGAVKGVRDIQKALSDPTLDPAARDAFSRRLETLMQVPGVKSAIAAQEKAARATEIQKLEMQTKEAQVREIKDNDDAAQLAQIVLGGGDINVLKSKHKQVPARVWEKVDKSVADWQKAKREAEKYKNDNTDRSSVYKGTKYEKTYDLLLKTGDTKTANEKVSQLVLSDITAKSTAQVKAATEFSRLDAKGKMLRILNSESQTEGWPLGGFVSDDMQEAYGELDTDAQEEVADFMAQTYAEARLAGMKEDDALAAATESAESMLGIAPSKPKDKPAPPVTQEALDKAMRRLDELQEQRHNRQNR